ncbi:signal transduction histidine kinase [Nocardia transvalensis]|uniref:histidine kinase n=1 Tax=Nocardia transvalensis TaxID=37333 RepID=A0A7W9PFE8_9NOCA|nr:ATP-binding protein [Nocardia transvalensis]MBB5914633.1 signal transduction histidine kinase [Nocardia transvalensis]
MGTAPRPWQRNLSNLSVTSKVGIVLLLPVVLASVFAGLRVKDELSTISQLNTASDQARIIRPMLEYTSAANQLAVTAAASGGAGDRRSEPALDQDAAHFDQALANLQAALQISKADKRVTTAITNALAAGRTLRESRHGTAPSQIGKQADEIATHIDNAISALPTPTETAIERYYVQMGVIAIARQMFTQEQLWIISGELGNNPALVNQALLSAGGESATIHQYAAVYPESADRPDVLLSSLQTRVDALGQNSVEPMNVPGVADSLKTSATIYTESTDRLVDLIDNSLAESLTEARGQVLRDVAAVVVTLLAGLALALGVARSLVVPVRRLRRDALQVAHEDLPAELAVVRKGGATPEIVPVDVQTTEEIGQLARAVDDMHRQALHLAADQARLRLQISSMFETLSRRSQSLVEQQLNLIEDLERDEEHPGRLQSLFRLDHLATRMRRNGDNLLVLAGTALRRGHLPPVPLSDMLWSAVSQVEDYQRVEIGSVPDGVVAGEPAVDIEHLLAELIDNSLRYSPPSTPVAVSVNRAVDGGYLIEITDRGLGMSADDLRGINERLASGGEVTVETARRMGLFVVGRLAKRHTITVSMRRTTGMTHQSGITASVHLPGPLVSPPEATTGPQPIAASFAMPGADPEPTDPRQQLLSAVPDLPETSRFATTTSGLPQRRPGASEESAAAAERPFALSESSARDGLIASNSSSLDMWAEPEDPTQARSEETEFLNRGALRDGGFGARVESRELEDFGAQDDSPDHESFGARGDFEDHESFAGAGDFEDHDSFGVREGSQDREDFGDRETFQDSAQGYRSLREMHAQEDLRDQRSFRDHEDTGDFEDAGDFEDSGDFRGHEDAEQPENLRDHGSFGARDDFQDSRGYGGRENFSDSADFADHRDHAADATPTTMLEVPRTGFPAPRAEPSPSSAEPGKREPATPIYQRMVSEWLVEPSAAAPAEMWTSPADDGWAAAAGATRPATTDRTTGGLPIRRPGAQLVPGGLTPADQGGAPDPEEIRNNLSRHLSGVRSGRADAQHNDDGGLS